jgi:putative acetyltransferase
MQLRQATTEDTYQILQLIDEVYHQYGDQLCLAGADSDLLDIEGNYASGKFCVLEENERIVATSAVLPDLTRPEVCLFRRLYLESTLRGSGWANQLMDWRLTWAIEQGMRRVEFWSDVRFTRAHSFFKKWGFIQGPRRQMGNGSMPYEEFFFSRNFTSAGVAPPAGTVQYVDFKNRGS